MKTLRYLNFNLSLVVLLLMFAFAANSWSQTPQYFNYNTAVGANAFPFSVVAGKQTQWLVLPGEFNQPGPAPSGNITKVWFYMGGTGSVTFTSLLIKMGDSAGLTTLPTGVIYTGRLDTVYYRASVGLSSTIGSWMSITLDRPFAYNNTKSLVIDVSQCGVTATGLTVYQTTLAGIRRTYPNHSGSCVFVYSGQGGQVANCGIDVTPAQVLCNKYFNSWCPLPTYPTLPAATYFNSAAWIGDTMYVQAPNTSGAGTTTVYRYTWGGTWTTGVPCLVGVTGASMTACNGKLYLIGGGTTTILTGTNNVQEYNPATGTWTARAPLPVALSAHGSVNWGDSVIFVVGGPYTGSGTNLAVHYYRPASNTWGTIASSLPSGQGRRTFALSITNGNKIVMTCGFNTVYLKSTYVGTIGSDASQIVWVAGLDAPIALSRPAGTGYDNYSFLVGGDTNTTAVKNDKVFMYNVTGNSWFNTILANPNPVSNMMNAVTAKCINDTVRIFQPGGFTTVATNNLVITGCGALVGINPVISQIPESFSLSQNYPNPFNPTTNIKFAIPKTGLVKLVVYDVLGREVAVLVNEYKKAGTHDVDFNGSNLSSGVYFYRIDAGDFTDTKKMLLIK